MIKKRKIQSFLKTLDYSLTQIRIELIERPLILGTLWNWSEDWKSSQVHLHFFFFNFTASRYTFLFLKRKKKKKTLRCCMLYHMNEVDPFIFCYVFLYEIQNCIFSMCFPNILLLPRDPFNIGKNTILVPTF